MASITSAGIGSGLDINSIVSQLVAAERAPDDRRLATAKSSAQTSISALGSFLASLSSLQVAANGLKVGATGSGGAGRLAATSGDSTIFTATAGNTAVQGNFDVQVEQLAQSQKLSSQLFASADTVVGDGPVTLSVGGNSFTVNLAPGKDTLADLRSQINAATDNTGVSAAIVADTGGVHLLLASKSTGTANAITVSGSLLTTTEVQPAKDAKVLVDGFETVSSSNTVTGAIDGITLTLSKPSASGVSTPLSIGVDQSASAAALQSFVTAYNQALSTIGNLSSYDPASKTAGPLLGDSVALSAQTQLRSIVGGIVGGQGSFSSLSQLGITTSKDGSLTLDSSKLSAALTKDYGSVQNLIGGTSGIATRLAGVLDGFTSGTGLIQAETNGYNAQLKDVQSQSDALDRRITMYQQQQMTQFTALDSMVAQLKSSGDFLTQQFAQIAKITSGN